MLTRVWCQSWRWWAWLPWTVAGYWRNSWRYPGHNTWCGPSSYSSHIPVHSSQKYQPSVSAKNISDEVKICWYIHVYVLTWQKAHLTTSQKEKMLYLWPRWWWLFSGPVSSFIWRGWNVTSSKICPFGLNSRLYLRGWLWLASNLRSASLVRPRPTSVPPWSSVSAWL